MFFKLFHYISSFNFSLHLNFGRPLLMWYETSIFFTLLPSCCQHLTRNKFLYIFRFVGCIGAVTFLHQNGGKAPAHYVSGQETSSGCLNACRETSCENKGKCLNRFTETSCDCIGTGYEGPKCTRGERLLHFRKFVKVIFDVTGSKKLMKTHHFRLCCKHWRNNHRF